MALEQEFYQIKTMKIKQMMMLQILKIEGYV
ncbi:uncharacterized protein G2W53_001787 [Senna tora]|uniref:Uncharacterized protein n=1 Tax=Senna tora TaxID=362788 RepID=A0A834XJA2_9FABA|nr:uncharacterized protein G2W53_001787 [Senna tora]